MVLLCKNMVLQKDNFSNRWISTKLTKVDFWIFLQKKKKKKCILSPVSYSDIYGWQYEAQKDNLRIYLLFISFLK